MGRSHMVYLPSVFCAPSGPRNSLYSSVPNLLASSKGCANGNTTINRNQSCPQSVHYTYAVPNRKGYFGKCSPKHHPYSYFGQSSDKTDSESSTLCSDHSSNDNSFSYEFKTSDTTKSNGRALPYAFARELKMQNGVSHDHLRSTADWWRERSRTFCCGDSVDGIFYWRHPVNSNDNVSNSVGRYDYVTPRGNGHTCLAHKCKWDNHIESKTHPTSLEVKADKLRHSENQRESPVKDSKMLELEGPRTPVALLIKEFETNQSYPVKSTRFEPMTFYGALYIRHLWCILHRPTCLSNCISTTYTSSCALPTF